MSKDQELKIGIGCIILAAINAVIFLFMFITHTAGNAEFMAGHGAVYFPYMLEQGTWYTLITAMFLHFDIEHLANNMVMLLAVGRYIEKNMGTVRFIVLYFLAGLAGNVLSLMGEIVSGDFAVSAGASGSVFGLVGALLAMTIKNRGSIEGLGIKQVLLMIALSLFSGFTSAGVNNVAHVGGLVTGLIIGLVLAKTDGNNGIIRG